ncbi:MAG: hypothetical protein ACOYOK_11285 [Pseudobdellovibrionaceae bacterium]
MLNNKATFAIYHNREDIKLTLRSLKKLGFLDQNFSVFQSKTNKDHDLEKVQKNQWFNGSMTGAVFGVVIIAGLYFCIIVDIIPSPLAQTVPIGWRIVAMIAGLALGAIAGAAAGLLVGVGIPSPVAKRYGQYLQSGGILLSVHSKNQEDILRAQNILQATGGQDVHCVDEEITWDKAITENIKLSDLEDEKQLS